LLYLQRMRETEDRVQVRRWDVSVFHFLDLSSPEIWFLSFLLFFSVYLFNTLSKFLFFVWSRGYLKDYLNDLCW
jgi:hypothetical protein